jgi:hypothetical protein
MHIAILPEEAEGTYPCRVRLPSSKVQNFKTEVGKLLPALYFLGASGHRTRSMSYRNPKIEDDKYSAICTHNGTAFEYRVFETCYDRPEAIYDFVQVIANTLKFYDDPTLKVKALGKKFGFHKTTSVAKYYDTPEQLRILNATVKYLKPEDKSFKALKAERGLYYSVKSLSIKEKQKIGQLRQDYQEYKKHYDYISERPLDTHEKSQVDWLIVEQDVLPDEAERLVKERRQGSLVDFGTFLKNNLTKRTTGATVTV